MPLLRSTIRTHLDRWMVSVDSQREAHDSESFRLKKNSFNYIYIDLLPLFITLVGSSSLKIHLFRTVSFLKKCKKNDLSVAFANRFLFKQREVRWFFFPTWATIRTPVECRSLR